MNKQIVTICLLISTLTGYSQNKKEQIEILNFRLDSCKTVLVNQNLVLNYKEVKISELEQKLLQEQQESEEKYKQIKLMDKQISLLKKEIDSLKQKIPAEASFAFKVVNVVENQDQRIGTDSETKVFLMIQNQLVDTYSEFGSPELDTSKNLIYLISEMSEKRYEIFSSSPTKVIVKSHFFCSDCEIQERELEKIYLKDVSGIWKFHSCKGEDCEDE